ncbi:YgfZ/GcvT domain-containing protein [Planctomycetes bacterium K23_9]|uniref:Putative global regulator n=1 Tax=Stieleria marina TaxID=1930275 RepID=A0A517NXG3_9BACT|nr:putative global regulator [Planctomycetes bacterium K23_9]
MNTPLIYQLNSLSVVDLDGSEATQILHNLTTNDIQSLPAIDTPAETVPTIGCESFITDVRGKTLGHVQVYRTATGFRLIGAIGQSQAIVDHADKYTIREDAMPSIRDDAFAAWVVERKSAISTKQALQTANATAPETDDSQSAVSLYDIQWLGDEFVLLLAPVSLSQSLLDHFAKSDTDVADEDAFHGARTGTGFPWYGIDLSNKNLPQEADRDATAISFTKGCYLGQETVARLDALGQVQKKLVRWSLDAANVIAGTELSHEDKVVGRLTSIAAESPGRASAIGVARRSHFDAGSTATGKTADGVPFVATVLE